MVNSNNVYSKFHTIRGQVLFNKIDWLHVNAQNSNINGKNNNNNNNNNHTYEPLQGVTVEYTL